VWACGEGQTDRHTDACDQYTFCVVYDSHEMQLSSPEHTGRPMQLTTFSDTQQRCPLTGIKECCVSQTSPQWG